MNPAPLESVLANPRDVLESIPSLVWEASWQATLLAGVVLCVQWTLKRQLSARWRNALWLLIFARLLLPALPRARFSAYNWFRRPSITAPAPMPVNQPAISGHESTAPAKDEPSTQPSFQQSTAASLRFPRPFTVLALGWLAGVLVTAASSIASYVRLRKRVKLSGAAANGVLREQFEEAKALLQVRRAELAVSTAVSSPFVTGFWKAKVILPEGLERRLDPGDLRMVLLHELSHVKRGDLWMAWLSWLVTTLHWFNPAVRFAMAQARKDREMACDEQVLRAVNDSAGYGRALIRFLEISLAAPMRLGFGGIGIFENKLTYVQRIRRIAAYRRATRAGSLTGFAALMVVGALMLTAATTDTPAPQMVINVLDGSRVVGTPMVDHFKLITSYSELDIKISALRTLELDKGGVHDAHISLQNGDMLNGKLGVEEFSVKTTFGTVTVPLEQVASIRMTGLSGSRKGLPGGLVLYYSFDEKSGDKAIDQSESGNDATIQGAENVDAGKIGAAVSFNGSSDVVVAKNEDKLRMQDFTIMAWVKRGSAEKPSNSWEDGVILTCGQAGYGVGIHKDGSIYLCKVGINAVFSTCKITDDKFHHVVVAKSGNDVVFYLDGKAYPSKFITHFDFGAGIGVGARPDITGPMAGHFLGVIDEVGVFERALTEGEVKGIYESQK